MHAAAKLSEREAWAEIERLKVAHGLASTGTPAGVQLAHATAGTLSLSLWDLHHDLAELRCWLHRTGLERA